MLFHRSQTYVVWSTLVLHLSLRAALAQEPQPQPPPLPVAAPAPVVAPEPPPAPVVPPPSESALIAALTQRIEVLEAESRQLHAPPNLARQSEPEQTETFEARWRNAFLIQSSDERFRLRIGGLVQADGRYFVGRTDPPPADSLNQFLLRRARLDLEADVWRIFSMRIQPDFAGGKIVLFDAYVDVKFMPELRFRFGKFKVPFGLERLQPGSSTFFLERGLPTEIAPNRDLGIQVSGDIAHALLSYAVGVFNGNVDNSTLDAATDDDKEVAARIYLQPFRLNHIEALHNLGIGGAFTYGVRNGSATNPNVLSIHSFGQSQIFGFVTGTTANNTTVANGPRLRWTAQASYFFWRIGFLGEYVSTNYNVQQGMNNASVGFSAWQTEATFLLTNDRAAYTGVEPRHPFAPWRRSIGAFELAFRYSGLQIDQSTFDGGYADITKSVRAAQTLAGGINWYMTVNTRLSFDYGRTDFSGGAGSGDRVPENVFIGRMQFVM